MFDNRERIEYIVQDERKMTRKELIYLGTLALIELDKIGAILDKCFKKCEEDLELEQNDK